MQNHRIHAFQLILFAAAAISLTGCTIARNASGPVAGAGFSGAVHGGQQPISYATIQLYAAGNTGYGSAYNYTTGTSLLGTHSVQTDGGGNFNITGDYTCPSAATEVYLVSTGGSPGLANAQANPNLVIMAALGPCGNLGPSTYINMNEATTIASVWALSPFMTGVTHIGTSANNPTGLTNAFAAVNKLVNIGSGQAAGSSAGVTVPSAKIYMLANILAACVNSPGGTAGDTSPCGTLFAATAVNGVAPADTLTAAMNLAQHPNLGVSSLPGLVTATAPFQPSMSGTPTDFSLVLTYSGSGLSAPAGIAADAAGNIWTANRGNNSVSEFSNLGAPLSGSTGYTAGSLSAPAAIAVDAGGNAWIANQSNSTVTEIAALGAGATVYSGGGLSAPSAIAIDQNGYVWVANSGASTVTQINTSGTLSTFSANSLSAPSAIAITSK